jgi:hypothetical protein
MTADRPPTLKELIWLRGWFRHLSTTGPKVVFRSGNTETPHPFPEDSRLKCLNTLAQIDALIDAHPDTTDQPK